MKSTARRSFRRRGKGARFSGAIGVFDGVHRGHSAILRRILHSAAQGRGKPLVITFDRHPLRTLAPHIVPRCLQTLEQRLATLSAMGFKRIFVLPFTPALARSSPRQFVERYLVRRLNLGELIIGYDFHFGHGGKGDARLLAKLGGEAGIRVSVIAPILDRGEPVSSTRIRKLVALGRMAEASRLLGRPFALIGRRVRGAGRGRRIGFPTINLKPENELLPPLGAYAVRMGKGGVPGVANLGVNPTFAGNAEKPILEVHLLSTARPNPASGKLQVSLIKHLRAERRFPSVEALKRQIARDKARAARLLRR